MSELVTCPFNPAHTIDRRKLLNHIEKCKKTAANFHEFSKCQYSYHYFRKGQEAEHYQTCKEAQLVNSERALWSEAKFAPAELIDNVSKTVVEDESWVVENSPAFEPQKLRDAAPHMVVPQGLSKAKRKAHRESERERLRNLDTEKEKKFIKTEPIEGEEEPAVRTPTSRIAARFKPTQDATLKEEGTSLSLSSTSMFSTSSIQASPSVGRGRGVLLGGWLNQPPRVGKEPSVFKQEDFPELR